MRGGSRRGAFWLAVGSGVLLLPKALSEASVGISGWSEDPGVALWFFLSSVFTLLIFVGAWALRRTSRLKLWGWVILVSATAQLLAGVTLYGYVLDDWLSLVLGVPRFLADPLLILGMLLGTMSGIWLIVEHKSSDTLA